MACIKCKKLKNANIKHLGGSLCLSCFNKIIEKRVRKTLREKNWINPKDCIIAIDNGTIKAKTGIYILESIFKKTPLRLEIKKQSVDSPVKTAKKQCKLMIPWTADDEVEEFLEAVFNNKKIPRTKKIKLLVNVSGEEVEVYAKANKIKGKKSKKSVLGKKLDKLEKRYPGSKFGLLKSIQA